MSGLRALAVAAGLMAAASGALACEPMVMEGRDHYATGTCGISYFDNGGMISEGLAPAVNLGNGFVRQTYFDGHACAATQSTVVVDCHAGQAVIFGPSGLIEIGGPRDGGAVAWGRLDRDVDAAARAGRPMPLTDILARARGMENAAIVPVVGKAVGISNGGATSPRRFDLACGCRAFYPGTTGGA